MTITAKQIRIIKMAVRALGIEDGDYRELLSQWYGRRSCTQLTREQANELIDHLQKSGFVLKPKKAGWHEVRGGADTAAGKPPGRLHGPPGASRRRGKNIVNLVSAEELAKLEAVAALIAWRYEDGLQRFLATRLGMKDGRVRTAGEAYRAIEGVKKLFENGMKQQHGPDWWLRRFDDAAVMAYIARHCPEEYR